MALTNVYTGSNGVLTLANEDTPEGKDAKVVIDHYQIQTVGRVTGIEIYVQTDLEEFHEVGRRLPTSLHPGNIHISGKITRAHINGALLFLLMGQLAKPVAVTEPQVQPVFNMVVTLTDPAVPGKRAGVELKGVKLQDWSFSLPEEDFVMENVTFKALTIRNADGEAPSGGGDVVVSNPAFPDSAAA